MKKLLTISLCIASLFAGPDIHTLIDYDAQDNYEAQKQEFNQIITSKPILKSKILRPIVPIPIPVVASNKNCYNNGVDILGGLNFTQNKSYLKDAPIAGIRLNKCVTNDTFIQVGYDRLFNSEYKESDDNSKESRYTKVDVKSGTHNINETNIDRFYLNGLYEFNNQNNLFPYILAGLGYERIHNEKFNEESGGFFNVGTGLKYKLTPNVNLITQATAIRKFKNNNIDFMAALGLGMVFGSIGAQNYTPVATQNRYQEPYVEHELVTITHEKPIVMPTNFIEEPIDTRVSYKEEPTTNEEKYYIQIAALFKNDLYENNSHYLNKLDSNNLPYEVKHTDIRGKSVQLLLVGPYDSDLDARKDLSKAKRVEKGAFIKKI